MRKFRNESRGYVTIETILSLSFFVLAIMFVYSQIKTVIAENIMQNAVNCMAKEASSYVYILDRLGMILEHDGDENQDINGLIESGNGAVNEIVDFTNNLFGDTGSDDMAAAMDQFINSVSASKSELVDGLNKLDKEDLKNAGITAGENAVKGLSNTVLADYYSTRLGEYLPMEKEKFCRVYGIEYNGGNPFSFASSRVFPTSDCDSVLVAVTFDTKSPVSFIPLKRKICKYAYAGAWVSSNKNKLGQ